MAEIAFSSVGEVQAVLLKRLLVFLEKIRHWVLFHFERLGVNSYWIVL